MNPAIQKIYLDSYIVPLNTIILLIIIPVILEIITLVFQKLYLDLCLV